MNRYKLQKLKFPSNCKVVKHEFTTYDPEIEFSENHSLNYLSEDLLQIEFEELDLIVDLGWYGGISNKKGLFKIHIIKDSNWENPIKIETSTSQLIIVKKLEDILSLLNK